MASVRSRPPRAPRGVPSTWPRRANIYQEGTGNNTRKIILHAEIKHVCVGQHILIAHNHECQEGTRNQTEPAEPNRTV